MLGKEARKVRRADFASEHTRGLRRWLLRAPAVEWPAVEIANAEPLRNLLRVATEPEHIGVVVLTCGLRRVWERVLVREGLFTPTRDASVAGPALRAAHQTLGWYLGLEYLPAILGLEEYPVQHVQGHHTNGYRLQHERETTIVALMRGGEPMALGLNEVFPEAAFLHATSPEDIKQERLQNQCALVLVVSVINAGKTLAHFIEHTRQLHSSIRILVVAGVVQDEVVSRRHHLARLMRRCNVFLIALRISGNKFTGKGTTDTGNRLFQWYG